MNCKNVLGKSARLAATCGLGLTLAFGGVAAPLTAMAAPAGTLTIKDAEDGTYKVSQIMVGDIVEKKITDAKVNEANKAKIVEAVNSVLNKNLDANDSYLNNKLQDAFAEAGKDPATALKLANELASKGLTADEKGTATNNKGTLTVSGLDQGYYLISSTAAAHQGATSAILVAIGGENMEAQIKIDYPTMDKTVSADGKNWTDAAELGVVDGKATSISYRLTGDVPSRVGEYSKYVYTFTDTLPTGLNTDEDDFNANWKWSAKIGNQDVTDSFVATVKDNTITWTCGNLNAIKDADLSGNSEVVIEYTPSIGKDDIDALFAKQSAFGSMPKNTANLTYSDSPYAVDSTQVTVDGSAEARSYNLVLTNSNAQGSEASLKGSKFELVNAKGEKVGHTISSNEEDGSFTLTGLTSGTYTLKQTGTAQGKKRMDDVTFTIKLDANGNAVIAEETNDPSNAADIKTDDANKATVDVTITSLDGINLPLTGQAGIVAGVVAGGLLITVSAVAIARNRRESE